MTEWKRPRQKIYYLEHKEEIKKKHQEYYQKHREEAIEKAKTYYQTHKDEHREICRRLRARNRGAYREKQAENKRKLRLKKPEIVRRKDREYEQKAHVKLKRNCRQHARRKISTEFCVKCGETNNLERHHPDYSKPLEVLVLCHECHRQVTFGD